MNVLYKSEYIALKQNIDVQTYLVPGRVSNVECHQTQANQAVEGQPNVRPFWDSGVPQPKHASSATCPQEDVRLKKTFDHESLKLDV